MVVSIHDSSGQWARQSPERLGSFSGLGSLFLWDPGRKPFPHQGLGFHIRESAEKGITITKSLASYQPEPCILESNGGGGHQEALGELSGLPDFKTHVGWPVLFLLFTEHLHRTVRPSLTRLSVHPSSGRWPCEPQR